MRIACVGLAAKSYEVGRIVEEGKKAGHNVETLKQISIHLGDSRVPIFLLNQKNALNYDAFIFNNISKYIPQALILANFLINNGKTLLDSRLGDKRYITSKFSTLYKLKSANIPIPKSFMVQSVEEGLKICGEVGYPVIIKSQIGSKGWGVYKAKDQKQAEEILKNENVSKNIIQQYVENKFDLRVLVIGDKVLGAIKRIAPKGDFRNNISLGGKGEVFQLSDELKQMAQKALQISENEFAGVDIIIGLDGKPYVIEVNRAPGFFGFETTTKINVAKEVIKYLEEKFKKGGGR